MRTVCQTSLHSAADSNGKLQTTSNKHFTSPPISRRFSRFLPALLNCNFYKHVSVQWIVISATIVRLDLPFDAADTLRN